jgi:hypothetical protein
MADRIPENYEKVRSKIKNWVIEEHCQFTPAKDAEWCWAYSVSKDQTSFTVFQYEGRPESLFLTVVIDLIEYQQLFQALTTEEQRNLVLNVRLSLAPQDVEYHVADDLVQVNLVRQLFVEDITRTTFWDKVFGLNKAVLVILWKVEQRLPLE